MARIILTYVLPLFGPLLLYLAWNAYARAKARKSGGEPPSLERGPIFWSIVAGFFLLMTGLVTLALTSGTDPDAGKYIAPRLEDGRVVPPRFEKD